MLEKQPDWSSSLHFDDFRQRHIGLTQEDQKKILNFLGYENLEKFLLDVIPKEIFDEQPIGNSLHEECSEIKALAELNVIAKKNQVQRSLIGLGYYPCATPAVVQRQVLENPSWYTAYTPYQAEISQGRLEALFNFQTLISELTGFPISNASLLDEATAAAEAMSLCFSARKKKDSRRFLVDKKVLPQTLSVLITRSAPLGIHLDVREIQEFNFSEDLFGVFLQLPGSDGRLFDPTDLVPKAHAVDALVSVSIDPLAQVLLKPVAELGVDIAVGSAQRYGIPMGFGGPHAAFFATRETFKRLVPGRLVGRSVDREGHPALRLALQTREQHIRRDKATSNICTAQVLLAIIASFFAIHHGPDGLENIAKRVVCFRARLQNYLVKLGYQIKEIPRFDCIEFNCIEAPEILRLSLAQGFNLRALPIGCNINNANGIGIAFDELSNENELLILSQIFAKVKKINLQEIADINLPLKELMPGIPLRNKPWLQQDIFKDYRSETCLLRYIESLANKDFSLVHGMIPLGSCTMKLNAASELIPISWPEFSNLHPFAPLDQSIGYQYLIEDLENWLADVTGFKGVSLQPNAGSQGELAGLLVIKAWHKSKAQEHRNICLIPTSAHGTNPASAVMAGMKVIPVLCDKYGNIDLDDLRSKADTYSSNLSALMVTYPSTHGVFEPDICEICNIIHAKGGQVYLDGANLNAQVGLCRPGQYGPDVCHLNLHKTFCIPHGGGGPGVGPIAVAKHLVDFLPGHSLVDCGGKKAIGALSAAPWGSAGILPISWMYMRMMGTHGLRLASSMAILSANYIAKRLEQYYPILFRGLNDLVAHECILDLRPLKKTAGVEVEDVAKRLMDYGFHAPTISWPVAGTLMVEPTESEGLSEIDRFCDSMIAIRLEISSIEDGEIDSKNNPLMRSPHTLHQVTSDEWDRPYTRKQAAFPLPDQLKSKFWPSVSRIDNAFGDRNLICTCSTFD